MRENLCRLLNSVHHDSFVSQDKVYVGWGPTRRYSVFCSLPRLFRRDPKLTTLTRTWYHLEVSSWQDTFLPSTGSR